jgi:hypothetical protein
MIQGIKTLHRREGKIQLFSKTRSVEYIAEYLELRTGNMDILVIS